MHGIKVRHQEAHIIISVLTQEDLNVNYIETDMKHDKEFFKNILMVNGKIVISYIKNICRG